MNFQGLRRKRGDDRRCLHQSCMSYCMIHGLTKCSVSRFIALSVSSRSTTSIFTTTAFQKLSISCRQYSAVSLNPESQKTIAAMAHNLPNLVKPTHYDITLYNFDLEKFSFSGDVSIKSTLRHSTLTVVSRNWTLLTTKSCLIRTSSKSKRRPSQQLRQRPKAQSRHKISHMMRLEGAPLSNSDRASNMITGRAFFLSSSMAY